MVKQCCVCNKTFSIFMSLVTTNDQLTCEECAQNKIKKDEHDRELERNRQSEDLKAAQQRRKMEQKEHQKMLEIKERTQADIEKQTNHRLELEKRMQDETERDCQHKRELQREEIKMKGKTAEAEARIAEAKANEANSVARVKSAEAEAKTAEANMKIEIAKAKQKEMEVRSMLWKKYFDPETKIQDKQLIMEEIKGLSISSGEDQNVKKVPVAVKEIKASKSKGGSVEVRPRRPWTTSKLPKLSQ